MGVPSAHDTTIARQEFVPKSTPIVCMLTGDQIRSADEDRGDDVEHVRAGAGLAGPIQPRLIGIDAHGLQGEIGEVDHAALDGARRILAVGELVLAVIAAIVAHERGVEIFDRLGNVPNIRS